MKKYLVDNKTMAILGMFDGCKIINVEGEEIVSNKLSTDIINESCLFYGCSLKGRVNGTKNLLGTTYKCPIILRESDEMVFFPTGSYRNSDCCWFALKYVQKYYIDRNFFLIIVFTNGKKIKLNLSISVFDKQLIKATRLLNVLKSRKK